MPPPGQGPEISIIAEMITPALLLMASGSLIATVLARIGRIVEYVRKIADAAQHADQRVSDEDRGLLNILEQRARLAEQALILYYGAVFLFVLTCLLIGLDRFLGHVIYAAPVASAMLGVAVVLVASGFMVAECRLAMQQLRGEVAAVAKAGS